MTLCLPRSKSETLEREYTDKKSKRTQKHTNVSKSIFPR